MTGNNDIGFVRDLARSAGAIAREHFGKVKRLTKQGDEAVTDADRACQRHIVAALRTRFPGDGIVGEESDTQMAPTLDYANPRGRVWVIDPIDGTNNFIAGVGAFAVCIGLLDAGEPTLGVVYDVTRDEMYWATRGGGAWLNDRPIQAAATPLSASSVVIMSSNLVGRDGRPPQWALRWVGQTTWKLRILGSAAIEAAQVAAGVAHGSVVINGKIWDVAAPAAIVLEAGGLMTDLRGTKIFPFNLEGYTGGKVPFLAAAPKAHEELLREVMWHP